MPGTHAKSSFGAQQRYCMRPRQPLRQQTVGEPGAESRPKTIAFGGHKSTGQHPDRLCPAADLTEFPTRALTTSSSGRSRVLPTPRRCSARSAVSRQACRPTGARRAAKARPGQRTKIAGACQQHGVAQCQRILDAAGLSCRHRGRDKRQALPPDPGPPFLPADYRIEGADSSTGSKRDLLNFLSRNALRIRDCPAQPGRDQGPRMTATASRSLPGWRERSLGRRIIEKQDESRRRF